MTDYYENDHRERKRGRIKRERKLRENKHDGDGKKPRRKDRTRSSEAREESARGRSKRRRHVTPKFHHKERVASKVVEPKPSPVKVSPAPVVVEEAPETKEVLVRESFSRAHEAGRCPHLTGYCDGELIWEFSDDSGDTQYHCDGYLRTLHWDA